MLKPLGVIFLILSLFASAVAQVTPTCSLAGDCSPVAEEDCSSCQHHHDDAPSQPSEEDESPSDDSEKPHDHHHHCKVACPSALPGRTVQLLAANFFRSPFAFLQARPIDVPPYRLEEPPRA